MTRECHVRFCESAGVRSPRATHLAVTIAGRRFWLWRAVDDEGEVLETVVTVKRDKAAALKLLKRIMKKYGAPRSIVTDRRRAPRPGRRAAA